MSETPSGYYSDADAIRSALGKHGPLSRADLVKASDVPRDVLAKSLYALKKKGDVMEEGDRVMLTKAANPAQDVREEAKASTPTTQPPECSTEQIKAVGYADALDTSVDNFIAVGAIRAVRELADEYRAILAEIQLLRTQVRSRDDEFAGLIADRDAYNTLKAKLRGMLDD